MLWPGFLALAMPLGSASTSNVARVKASSCPQRQGNRLYLDEGHWLVQPVLAYERSGEYLLP